MFEDYSKGEKCPMCKRIAIKLTEVNGQKACHLCKKKIKQGQEIIPYKASDYRGLTKVEEYHMREKIKAREKKEAFLAEKENFAKAQEKQKDKGKRIEEENLKTGIVVGAFVKAKTDKERLKDKKLEIVKIFRDTVHVRKVDTGETFRLKGFKYEVLENGTDI